MAHLFLISLFLTEDNSAALAKFVHLFWWHDQGLRISVKLNALYLTNGAYKCHLSCSPKGNQSFRSSFRILNKQISCPLIVLMILILKIKPEKSGYTVQPVCEKPVHFNRVQIVEV